MLPGFCCAPGLGGLLQLWLPLHLLGHRAFTPQPYAWAQEATFGVLYTLSKEKFSEGWRWVLVTMVGRRRRRHHCRCFSHARSYKWPHIPSSRLCRPLFLALRLCRSSTTCSWPCFLSATCELLPYWAVGLQHCVSSAGPADCCAAFPSGSCSPEPNTLCSFMWTMNFSAWQWKWLSWICFTNSEWRAGAVWLRSSVCHEWMRTAAAQS